MAEGGGEQIDLLIKFFYAASFYGFELAAVPYKTFEELGMMWEDIDYANEVAFPRALQRACAEGAEDGEAYAALAVGKAKNEVLLHTVSGIRSPG